MDIVSRLKMFLDANGIANSQFADNCKIPRPTLSQMLNGRNKKVSDEVISKIHAAYPSLSILWLLFGEGPMSADGNIEISEPHNQRKSGNSSVQSIIHEQFTEIGNDHESVSENSPNNFPDPYTINFDTPDSKLHGAEPTGTTPKSTPISIIPEAFKKITNIVVFYSDNSFQSFMPSPNNN